MQKALIDDLETTRELCVQLDRSKESMSTQLSTQTMQYEQVSPHTLKTSSLSVPTSQLHCELGDLKAERDLLKAQLNTEQTSSNKLHSVISMERQREFQAHAMGREKEEEIMQLRQLLAKMEADR